MVLIPVKSRRPVQSSEAGPSLAVPSRDDDRRRDRSTSTCHPASDSKLRRPGNRDVNGAPFLNHGSHPPIEVNAHMNTWFILLLSLKMNIKKHISSVRSNVIANMNVTASSVWSIWTSSHSAALQALAVAHAKTRKMLAASIAGECRRSTPYNGYSQVKETEGSKIIHATSADLNACSMMIDI